MSTKAKANKPDPVEAIDDQPEPVDAEALGGGPAASWATGWRSSASG